MKNVIAKSLVLFTVLGYAVASHAFGLDDVTGKDKEKDSSGSSSVSASAQQETLVKSYSSAMLDVTDAQILLSKAFGLKELASALEVEKDALSSGSVMDKDAMEKHKETSDNANAAIAAKLSSGEELSGESKEQYVLGFISYVSGAMKTKSLAQEITDFPDNVKNEVSNAPMMKRAKLVTKFESGKYVASNIPGFVNTLVTTSGQLLSYANAHEIELPKASTDALGDL